MNNMKLKINNLLSDYKINKEYLKECLTTVYNAGSRMPYYIVDKKQKKLSAERKDILWKKFGIPHQIFLDLDRYLEEEKPKK